MGERSVSPASLVASCLYQCTGTYRIHSLTQTPMTVSLHRMNGVKPIIKTTLATAVLAATMTAIPAQAQASDGLLQQALGSSLADTGIKVRGWAQVGVIANNNSTDDVSKQAFLNSEEGANLNQLALMIEKPLKSNLLTRITPTPAPMPTEMDWGFTLTTIYGKDAQFFITDGLDDDFGVNADGDTSDEAFTLTQGFLEFYFPLLGGSNLMLGLFHTPLENEIGFAEPAPAPTDFYSRSYAFMHGPAKHAGALYAFKLPSAAGESLLGAEIGLVRGWNNLQERNGDLDLIANLRWRSADMKSWIDWENIVGNGASDSFASCGCGSPYPAIPDADGDARRYASYLTYSRVLDASNRIALEMTAGEQENAALNGGADAQWYGANLNWYHRLSEQLVWNSRLEWFNAEDPANVVVTGAAAGKPPGQWSSGQFYALTTNVSWYPMPSVRLRPELRYDIQHSDGPNAFANGSRDRQFVASLDATFYF